jgi:hypothetical protein
MESDLCPKCGYRRQPQDTVPDTECPRCGIVFAKYAKYHAVESAGPAAEPAVTTLDDAPEQGWRESLKGRLLELPEQLDEMTLILRALLFGAFLVWGMRLIAYDWHTARIMESFLHLVNLPFHEFGHVLFGPFGRWLMFLGGSLFQCLLPAILGAIFLFRYRDAFAASFCLWWTGENFLDVAPYIGDARLMAMPLTGEWNDDVAELHAQRHDWHNILEPLGLLSWDFRLAAVAHTLGAVLMLLAWVWGGLWLYRAWRKLRLGDAG